MSAQTLLTAVETRCWPVANVLPKTSRPVVKRSSRWSSVTCLFVSVLVSCVIEMTREGIEESTGVLLRQSSLDVLYREAASARMFRLDDVEELRVLVRDKH